MKPNNFIPSKYRHFIEQNAWMVGGNILFAIGVNMIVTPMGLYNGGFMGLAQLLRLLCVNVLHIPVPAGFDLVGVIYFLENVPLFFVAYKVVGKEFCFKSLGPSASHLWLWHWFPCRPHQSCMIPWRPALWAASSPEAAPAW